MILNYVGQNTSFSNLCMDVLNRLKDKGNASFAEIVVADPQLFENSIQNDVVGTPSLGMLNLSQRIQLRLIESYDDLIQVLFESLDSNIGQYSESSENDSQKIQLIAFYGILEHYLNQGTHLYGSQTKERINTDPFMELNQYSAQSVNFICFLLQRLSGCERCEVLLCGPEFNILRNGALPNIGQNYTNIEMSDSSPHHNGEYSIHPSQSTNNDLDEVQLMTILRKWVNFI